MGVYDKLLKKHYTPPQRQAPGSPQELKQIPGKQEDARTLPSVNANAEQRKLAKAQGISLYADQLTYLRYHKALMQLENKKIDIVEMIREAVDTYITILKKKKENPLNNAKTLPSENANALVR